MVKAGAFPAAYAGRYARGFGKGHYNSGSFSQ